MTIDKFIKSKEGWDEMPNLLPGTLVLLRLEDGINVNISLRDMKDEKIIHVSIGPLRSCKKELSDEEHASLLLKETPKILMQLFGNEYKFQRMPQDPLKKDLNHYFSESVLV